MRKILLFDLKKITLLPIDYSILQNNTKDTILLQLDGNSFDFLKNVQKNEALFVISDTDAAIAHWKRENVPCIAWSHDHNTRESLMGASWMILSLDALTNDYLDEIYCRFHGLPLTICETEHWLLRELTMEDLPHLIELDAEQDAHSAGRFFPANGSDSKQFLADYIKHQYAFYGFGIYAAYGIRFINNIKQLYFLGIVGFSSIEEDADKIEIGYAVKKEAQGNGFATQWVRHAITYAKEQLDIPKENILTRIHPENIASIKVARNCGLSITIYGVQTPPTKHLSS